MGTYLAPPEGIEPSRSRFGDAPVAVITMGIGRVCGNRTRIWGLRAPHPVLFRRTPHYGLASGNRIHISGFTAPRSNYLSYDKYVWAMLSYYTNPRV